MSKFQKGVSGNPAGRPKGNVTVLALRSYIYDAMPEILASIILKAKMGDVDAAKLLIDRAIPVLKPAVEPVHFEIAQNDTATDTAQAIIDSMSRGEISPDSCTVALVALGEKLKIAPLQQAAKGIEASTKWDDAFNND